ncbi:MAG: hypothetical protein K2Y37_24865 [Pirellulales bacterium]|nr:hypothetical protein [Pirellulales bacterium]
MHADLNYEEEQPDYSSSNDEKAKQYRRANSPKAKNARKARRNSPVPGGGMARRRNKHWQW